MKKIGPLVATMISTICFTGSISIGQVGLIQGANDPSKADLKVLTENRSLISTTIDPFKGQAEGYVVGMDEGSVDINDFKLFLEGMKAEQKNHIALATTSVDPAPAKINLNRHKKKSKRGLSKNRNLQARNADKI